LNTVIPVLALRGLALGGRFVFVIFATKYMMPQDFGRFGLLAALALVIPAVVGLEAYQVLLRRILQEPGRAPDTRRFYATFVLVGSLVTGSIGASILAGFGWSATEVGLGTAVLMLEHIGLETVRNLVNERLPTLSVVSAALRNGAWGVAVPAFFFAGLIPAPWTFETVLGFWIVGAFGAALVGVPIWRLFRPHGRDLCPRRGWVLLKEVFDPSWTWMVYIVGLHAITTGGRFVCAWMISEAAAGRFTFISMLASLSYAAQKGVVETIYYPQLVAHDATETVHRQFRRMNIAVIAGGTLCSIIGLASTAWLNRLVPPVAELVGFSLLCIAFAFLSFSQLAHYRLYRCHMDKAIAIAGCAGGAATVLLSVIATPLWGIGGAAASTLCGALVLLVVKSYASKDLPR